MNAIVTAVVALLGEILPLINTSASVAKIIQALVQIIPVLAQVASDLIQPVKNIIAALSANPAATADQLAQLQTLDQQCDEAFEAAATAAQAEDSTP